MCKIKLHLKLVIFFALFLLDPKNVLADCIWGGPFLENIVQSDLIVRGKILAYYERTTLSSPPPSLEIEVLETYQGMLDNSKIKIIDDPSFGIGLFNFPVGTEWILALTGTNGKYTIPGCWGSSLKVEASVVGNLNNIVEPGATQRVGLDEFKNLLKGTEPSPSDYEKGVQAGLRQCKVSYEPKSGKLYIPAVEVPDALGNITIYEVVLNQRLPSFVFDLDVNSVKAHQ